MDNFHFEWDPDGILTISLLDHLNLAQARAMLAELGRQLESSTSDVKLLIRRERLVWMPLDAQVEAGHLLRHPRLGRAAILGPQISGGAIIHFIGRIGHKDVRFFEEESAARAYLLGDVAA